MTTDLPRAFVAGATGYTGNELVKLLREKGIATVAHIRPGSSSLARYEAAFTKIGATIDTTPWEKDAFAKAIAAHAPTIVFALLGTTRARMNSAEKAGENRESQSYETVDYGLTALLLRATKQSAPNARFVYLSSLGVQEGTTNPYLAARVKLERELRESGLAYTIARPSFITGDDRSENRVGEKVGAAVVDGALSMIAAFGGKKLRARYASMNAHELASGLLRAALDENARNKVLETEALR